MSRAGERLRAETQARAKGEWRGKLSKIGMWLQAAEWLDKNVPDLSSGGGAIDQEVLAEALRAQNMRYHPDTGGWEGITDSAKAIWMDRARQQQEQIDEALKRRNTT